MLHDNAPLDHKPSLLEQSGELKRAAAAQTQRIKAIEQLPSSNKQATWQIDAFGE